MKERIWFRIYRYTAAAILIIAAAGKLIASGSDAKMLGVYDPIFLIPARHMLVIASVLELMVAILCIKATRRWAFGLALLSTNFIIYRVGLFWVGYIKPCNCFGGLTDALRLSQATADHIMLTILVYLLVGSYLALYLLWKAKRDVLPDDDIEIREPASALKQ